MLPPSVLNALMVAIVLETRIKGAVTIKSTSQLQLNNSKQTNAGNMIESYSCLMSMCSKPDLPSIVYLNKRKVIRHLNATTLSTQMSRIHSFHFERSHISVNCTAAELNCKTVRAYSSNLSRRENIISPKKSQTAMHVFLRRFWMIFRFLSVNSERYSLFRNLSKIGWMGWLSQILRRVHLFLQQ